MPGRLTLITGVGREGQVGETVAQMFAARGDHVLLVSRSADEVGARAAALRAAGYETSAYACDLADEAQVVALAERVAAEHGPRLDALVNLAGGFSLSGPVAESRLDDWERLTRINVRTAYLATRAFLPALRAGRGAIVYFGSEAALPGAPVANVWAYAAAKGAVLTLMRAVAREERDTGVRANAVAPTSIRTAANLESMGASARYVEREDVAEAVWFLCSDAARAVTGQIMRLA
ncbi:MAG: SDR family oxidoreductase [Gemmatimonadota bacterium]|nr:SDR family oxidoreductase [Gemmatimonadota bacterium]